MKKVKPLSIVYTKEEIDLVKKVILNAFELSIEKMFYSLTDKDKCRVLDAVFLKEYSPDNAREVNKAIFARRPITPMTVEYDEGKFVVVTPVWKNRDNKFFPDGAADSAKTMLRMIFNNWVDEENEEESPLDVPKFIEEIMHNDDFVNARYLIVPFTMDTVCECSKRDVKAK